MNIIFKIIVCFSLFFTGAFGAILTEWKEKTGVVRKSDITYMEKNGITSDSYLK
ncbi:hypothetical protein [Arcobacter sp. LA11]|uniref:hypothetical protein n=1 Tax=Arcobacter sp. LA11 TaxID=1898176 RepID=UPI001575D4E5|nr:hypothetical protein [Arcobacter sp. LA11]